MIQRLIASALACCLLGGCQVHFISDYDATTDRGVTELQRAIERHLGQLETLAAEPPGLEALTEQCRPERFAKTYEDLDSDLRVLILRNEARDKNTQTVAQLRALLASIDGLRKQQQERYAPTDPDRQIRRPGDHCMSAGQLQAIRGILEQNIRAILTLELAKREFRQED